MLYLVLLTLIVASVWLVWQLRSLRSVQEPGSTAFPLRVRIEAFTGFGRPALFRVAGRVSKDGGRFSALNAEFDLAGVGTKLRRNLRRFLLPELEGVALEIRVGDLVRDTTTGAKGKFKVRFENEGVLSPGMTTYSVRLHANETRYEAEKGIGQILIPPEDAQLGVISDVDDTIVRSHTRNKIRMLLHTILTNVSDLHPTPGIAALLHELSVGPDRRGTNPVFYVSGSPANLHYKLHAFLRANRFPVGPLFLTALGRDAGESFFHQQIFKTESIREIFRTYPKLRFVLLGDNGQVDSDIYQDIAEEFPRRVALALIMEHVPWERSAKILPVGQHRISSALDAGILLFRQSWISRDGLQNIVHDLIAAGSLPDGFNLERRLRKIERRDRDRLRLLRR